MSNARFEQDHLQIRLRQQAAVAELGRRALAIDDLDAFLADACELIGDRLDVEFVKVLQRLPGSDELLLRAGTGWRPGLVGSAILPGGPDSQAGYALQSGELQIVEDLATDQRFRSPPLLVSHGVVSGVSVLIRGPRRPYGVLGAHTARHRVFSYDDATFLQSIANVLAAAIEQYRHATMRDLLAETSDLLNSSLDYEQTLRSLAALLVRRLGDWCAVHVVDEDGAIREIEIAHRDPAMIERVRQFRTQYAVGPDSGRGVRWVLNSAQPEVYSWIPPDAIERMPGAEDYRELLELLEIRSAMLLPMVARDRTLGVIQLVSSSARRRYGYEDVTVGMELASRAALAVDNARLYRLAQQTASVREAFLSSVSHELRTPLTSVLGFAYRLSRRADRLDEETRSDIETLAAEARRMRATLDSLMDLAHLESGRIELAPEPVELRRLLGDEAQTFRRRFPELRLDEEYPSEPFILLTDADRVRHVITNLLDNAAKHGGTPGHVTLSLRANDTGASVVVRDRGPGIASELQDQIFARFSRGPTASGKPGMGLGLYLARLIAERLGGRLMVSDAEGGGAEFTLSLPLSVGSAVVDGE